jgi:two-component system, NtrC family, sensor kinase
MKVHGFPVPFAAAAAWRKRLDMPAAQKRAIGALRLAMAICVLVPLVLLGLAAWTTRSQDFLRAEQKLDNQLTLLKEHAERIFHSTELALDFARTLTADMTDEQLQAREPELHAALERITEKLSGTQSIWVIGRDGVTIVSSVRSPAPKIDTRDRDYYHTLRAGDPGVFLSAVYASRADLPAFFSMDRRRSSANGAFGGIVDVGLLPADIERFYRELDDSGHEYFAMVRADGAILARYPTPVTPQAFLPSGDALTLAAATTIPGGGRLTEGTLDGIERILHYRPVPDYSVTLIAGMETGAVQSQWLATLGRYLSIAVPAEIALLLALAYAIRRTNRYFEESERRQAAELALGRAQRLEAVGQLTGGVAHDFNNLLTVVGSGAENARRNIDDPNRVLRSLDMISRAVERGVALTRQLLSFAGRQPLRVETFDVCEHVRRFEDMVRRTMPGAVEPVVNAPPTACFVSVDPDELDLALLNIAVNARDAMPQGGSLTISVRCVKLNGGSTAAGLEGAFVAVSMTDTGSGVPPDALPRVFEPFFTTKETGKGTGLGLSQVYGFARQSGGVATIDSTPGLGTTVTIYLPQTSPRQGAAARN